MLDMPLVVFADQTVPLRYRVSNKELQWPGRVACRH